jgi:transketolase
VREFGMAAIMNGVALHGGFIPYGGTFLTFSDYSRNAIRMAALMKQRVIHVFTHDSIGLGEDGPTHQSIEHAASLRLIPNLDVWRPADTAETAVAWAVALQNANRPSALLLSRQNLPYAPKADLGDISRALRAGRAGRGGPEEEGPGGDHRHRLRSAAGAQGAGSCWPRNTRSPCAWSPCPAPPVFDRQDAAYKAAVLPKPACRAWPSRWARPTAGGSTACRPWSASTPTANRPRAGAVQALRLHA